MPLSDFFASKKSRALIIRPESRLPISSDPYTTLGVTRQQPASEVRRAWLQLCLYWDPDNNKEPHAKIYFEAVLRAYQKIIDDSKISLTFNPLHRPRPAPMIFSFAQSRLVQGINIFLLSIKRSPLGEEGHCNGLSYLFTLHILNDALDLFCRKMRCVAALQDYRLRHNLVLEDQTRSNAHAPSDILYDVFSFTEAMQLLQKPDDVLESNPIFSDYNLPTTAKAQELYQYELPNGQCGYIYVLSHDIFVRAAIISQDNIRVGWEYDFLIWAENKVVILAANQQTIELVQSVIDSGQLDNHSHNKIVSRQSETYSTTDLIAPKGFECVLKHVGFCQMEDAAGELPERASRNYIQSLLTRMSDPEFGDSPLTLHLSFGPKSRIVHHLVAIYYNHEEQRFYYHDSNFPGGILINKHIENVLSYVKRSINLIYPMIEENKLDHPMSDIVWPGLRLNFELLGIDIISAHTLDKIFPEHKLKHSYQFACVTAGIESAQAKQLRFFEEAKGMLLGFSLEDVQSRWYTNLHAQWVESGSPISLVRNLSLYELSLLAEIFYGKVISALVDDEQGHVNNFKEDDHASSAEGDDKAERRVLAEVDLLNLISPMSPS